MSEIFKYPKIQSLRNLLKQHPELKNYDGEVLVTPKIHGSNLSVRIEVDDMYIDTFTCFSRNQELGPHSNLYGAYHFLQERKAQFIKWANECFLFNNNVTIFMEFAGEGIQTGMGISQTPKSLYILDVYVDEHRQTYFDLDSFPSDIPDVFNLVEFSQMYPLGQSLDNIKRDHGLQKIFNDTVKECPVAKELFDISGPGEGIVVREPTNKFVFKIVDEKFKERSNKPRKAKETFDEKLVNDVLECLTPARMVKAIANLHEIGKSVEKSSTPFILRWLVNDIYEEEKIDPEVIKSVVGRNGAKLYFEVAEL